MEIKKFCKIIFTLAICLDVISFIENIATLVTSNDDNELRIARTGLFLDICYFIVASLGVLYCGGV